MLGGREAHVGLKGSWPSVVLRLYSHLHPILFLRVPGCKQSSENASSRYQHKRQSARVHGRQCGAQTCSRGLTHHLTCHPCTSGSISCESLSEEALAPPLQSRSALETVRLPDRAGARYAGVAGRWDARTHTEPVLAHLAPDSRKTAGAGKNEHTALPATSFPPHAK